MLGSVRWQKGIRCYLPMLRCIRQTVLPLPAIACHGNAFRFGVALIFLFLSGETCNYRDG